MRGRGDVEKRGLRLAVETVLREELAVTGIHQVCERCGGPDHGRPRVRVDDGPAPHVSWSYTARCAVVAWTWAAPIGVDVEADGPDLAGVGDRAAWTRTEAVLKATGEGLSRSPSVVGHDDVWVAGLSLPAAYVGHVAVVGAHRVAPEVSWRLVGPAAPSG